MLRVIADDVTGACDVGAELATGGFPVRVLVDGPAGAADDERLEVVNTQSRTIGAGAAYERVLRLLRDHPADLLLKKIDTALRGHLGAELEAAVDGLGAMAAFVLPAIPAAGRVTRDGCQWFGGRPLAATEFARDPEGPGAESSISCVMARESRRRTEVIGLAIVRAGKLAERVRALTRAGVSFFVVDAETDADLAAATTAILELPRPLCLAGSVGLTQALLPALRSGEAAGGRAAADGPFGGSVHGPALVISGSMHPMAARQLALLVERGLAVALSVSVATGAAERSATIAAARSHLAEGRSVILAPPSVADAPDATGRRGVERLLGELASAVVNIVRPRALVLIGGETAHAVLARLGTTALTSRGRPCPLVALGEVETGQAAGMTILTKGGSGGEPETLAELLATRVGLAPLAVGGAGI